MAKKQYLDQEGLETFWGLVDERKQDTLDESFTPATAITDGEAGLVPKPSAGDDEKFLRGDGTWVAVEGGGGSGGTTNFNALENRPKYNGTTMTGNTDIPEVPSAVSDLTNDEGFQTATEVNAAISAHNANTTAHSDIREAISTETSARQSADSALQTQIDGKQDKLTAGQNITIENNVISATGGGGGGTTYTAGNGLTLTGTEFSADTTVLATQSDLSTGLSTKQNTLTAGDNVTISGNTISATDTTYSAFTGTDGTAAGSAGLVPAPATTDADKFLKADGTWETPAGGGGSSVNVVQTTGTSTTDVMSQNAVTSMVFADPGTKYKIKIGDSASVSGNNGIAIGLSSSASGNQGVALGPNAKVTHNGSVAIGQGSKTSVAGEVSFGGTANVFTYNSSGYRLLTGLYDGQSDHDAVTVGQVNAVIDAINTALNTNISHIGSGS